MSPTPAAADGRIVLLAHRLAAPTATGIGRYVAELATALTAADPSRFALAAPHEDEPVAWAPPGVPIVRLRGNRRALLAAWTFTGRPSFEAVAGRPQLVHSLSPFAPIPTAAPAVFTVHDLMPFEWPEWYGRGEGLGFRRAVGRAAAEGRRMITPSTFVADEVVARLAVPRERITVVAEGVPPEFAATRPSAAVCARYGVEPGRYVVVVGAVSSRKNAAVVARAIAQLPDLRLLLAGPPGDGTAAVQRLGLGDRVVLAGYVPDADLPPLVAGAHALAHPSRAEGFGLTPLEAMAAGTPTVVAGAGALPETVGDAALVVDPDDPDGWAAALTSLDDGDVRARLVAAGRDRAAAFTWGRAAAETLAVYEQALAERSGSGGTARPRRG